MQHATCFLLCSAAIALHGCLCSATDHTDVCTPVSGADGVLRPLCLGDNDIDNVLISVSMLLLDVIRLPQHRHYDDMMWWRNPCAMATTNVSASLLVDCHKSDPSLVVRGVTTLSIR